MNQEILTSILKDHKEILQEVVEDLKVKSLENPEQPEWKHALIKFNLHLEFIENYLKEDTSECCKCHKCEGDCLEI